MPVQRFVIRRGVGRWEILATRRLRLPLVVGLTVALLPSVATAQPLILPHPAFRAGHFGALQVVAPARASSCELVIGGRHYRPVRHTVPLGSPTRVIRWKVGRSARGRFRVAFTCRGRRRSLGSFESDIVVGRSGAPRGVVAERGSLRVYHGAVPEMPSKTMTAVASRLDHGPARSIPRALVSPDFGLSGPQVNINPCSGGNVVGCFNPCPNSEEIASTRTTGDGAATVVQVVPTFAAHVNAAAALDTLSISSAVLQEDYSLYRTMWSDLNRCANLPSDLSPGERHSIYEQMACHALYGVTKYGAGNTWDFESWRDNIDWSDALWLRKSCGQGYGNVPNAAGFLDNRLIEGFNTITSTLFPNASFPTTWLVDEHTVLRRVASTTGYGCFLARGFAAPRWYPVEFIDTYFHGHTGPDVADSEACPPGNSTGPSGGTGRVSLSQGPAAPVGYRYNVSLANWPASTSVSVTCFDSASPSGFYTFSLTTDSGGTASTSSACYSGDGPDHWVVANGVESNHVSWTSGSSPNPPTAPAPSRVDAYSNYGPANAGHAMCRGNPGRPESMPGGTARQSLAVPNGVASLDTALVQIDPDSTVTAHLSLYVNGALRASADATAAGDTRFGFSSVAVSPGDQVVVSINFTASFGKIITVYTAGSPGGTFRASNSCSDGAPNDTDSTTGLRAVVSGWSG